MGTCWRGWAAGLATIGLLSAGCGNDDDDAATSEQISGAALAEINTLCMQRNEAADALFGNITGTPSMTQLGELVPISEDFVTGLGAVDVPPDAELVIAEAITSYEAGITLLTSAIETNDTEVAFAEALPALGAGDGALRDLGAEDCGEEEEGADEAAADATQVSVTADEYSYQIEASYPAGPFAFELDNVGVEEHDLVLFSLREGATAEEVVAALDAGEEPEPFFEEQIGATNALPGEQRFLNVELEPGSYFIACTINAPDGEPHFHKGMVASFDVTDEG